LHAIGWRPPVEPKTCSVEECDRKMVKRELCHTHYRQQWRTGQTQPIRQSDGRRVDPVSGYAYVRAPGSLEAKKGGWGLEHRVVMSNHLGRPLWPDESVHHVNGQRDDNRLENLELWSRQQPAGQRVEDKLAWCREFLARYEGQLP
jgi:HNH endonuclease